MMQRVYHNLQNYYFILQIFISVPCDGRAANATPGTATAAAAEGPKSATHLPLDLSLPNRKEILQHWSQDF